MKTTNILAALIPSLFLCAPATAQVVIDSSSPGIYVDISTTGTPLSLIDDGEVDIITTVGNALLPAGIARVGSNGAVRFGGAGQDLAYVNEALPSVAAFSNGQTLFPFWDDIDTDAGLDGEIYWQEIGGTLIVQWENAAFFPGGGDTATFQLQVHSAGAVFAQFLYQDVQQLRADGGGSATIGYQGAGCGTDFVEWSFDLSGSVADGDVLSISGTPPPPPSLNKISVVDSIPGTYIDISATGTPLSLSDDDAVDIATTVGNSIFAAGTARVGSNGAVRFAGAGTSLGYINGAIPSASAFSGDQTLMPFWDDVDSDSGLDGEIYWQEISGTLIIQWENVAFYPGGGDTATFQLQVHSAGSALAQFLYQDIEQLRASGGESATIGYQGRPCVDTDAQWSFDTSGAVSNGDVLSFTASSIGTNYCVSNPNSTGSAAIMDAAGSASIVDNDVVLGAEPVPNQPGIFFHANNQVQIPFGEGFLCAVGTIVRLSPGVASMNRAERAVDLPGALITTAGAVNFQYWYRDPAGGGSFFNTSDGIEIVFVP